MVSLYLNPPAPDFYMMDPMKIGLPVLNSVPPDSATTAADIVVAGNANLSTGLLTEDPNKKVRKPYTITKSRESWTEQEHDKFLEALHLFDRDWKKIEAFVGSKTVIQIRSHAQKYFLKVQKNGISEHVPPPRPKRKATHPYPQKAPKKVTTPFQSSCALFETAPYIIGQDSVVVPGNMFSSANLTSWPSSNVPLVSTSQVMKDDVELSCETMGHNSCSGSNQSPPKVCPTRGTHNQGKEKQNKPMRAMPDFAQVYNFIGSLFDPNKSDHLQKLKKMDPINVETVLLLMKNLSVNLTSPEFENHRRMLSSYDVDSAKVITSSSSQFNNFHPGSRMLEA